MRLMYDALAEIFVCGVAVAYVVLFIVLAVRWFRGRSRPKGSSHLKPPGSGSQPAHP